MPSYFISDLHLKPDNPQLTKAFTQFLEQHAKQADSIYLLGDLFEYWIGDDAAPLVGAIEILHNMLEAAQHCQCYFIAGNRDFLVGPDFEQSSGFKILADESVIDLYGTPTVILHGDSLCTDDHAHQQFRQQMVTNEEWRQAFLTLPIEQRVEQAMQARAESHKHKSQISMEIMDVSQTAVLALFADKHVTQMVHGHTHRQNIHKYQADNIELVRHVLGDWGATSSIIIAHENGSLSHQNEPIV